MAEDWTDEELGAAVDAYREMSRFEDERRAYSKREVYRNLAKRFPRTEKAFEYRMQNISSVLQELQRPWVPGLKPAANVGPNVRARLIEILDRKPTRKARKADDGAAYKAKLPALRDWLIRLARHQKTVTYGEVMNAFGIDRFSLRHAMDFIGHQSDNQDEPILTAVIVSKSTQHCSPGLEAEFGVTDDVAEREKLFAYWRVVDRNDESSDHSQKLEARAARFASVEIRPDQAAFRRLVFEACGGKCVVSGCDVEKALDAAHLLGRDWRKGQNGASDGILLRKDIHALYDANLLCITADGTITCEAQYYEEYRGTSISVAIRKVELAA